MNTSNTVRNSFVFSWSLTVAVSLLALFAWASNYFGHFQHVGPYDIFPLLGLLAFSIMWSQYVSGAVLKLYEVDTETLKSYFQYTGYAVLLLICLHPGILIAQRYVDGYGLPPGSYKSYVQPSLHLALFLGPASLVIFLCYELKRFFDKKRWWPFVTVAVDAAMLAIFYHGLKLGGQLSQNSWFRTVWVFYGVVLIVILAHKYIALGMQYRKKTSGK